ncbi:MAG: TonB-dependent receptor [Nitrospira sp.]|nr:TonB-dependent receptor [Nitrospira sp.]
MGRFITAWGIFVGTWLLVAATGFAQTEEPGGPEAHSEVALDEVEVAGVKSRGFIEEKTTQPRTESTVTKEGIQKLGGPAQTSVYQTLRMLPSVTVETADPYGLNTRTPFNLRVRGQPGKGTAMTIEGVPVWAQESPGPRPDMLDLENIAGITLYRGAIPPDKGLGAMDIAGNIDLRVLRPSDRFGVDVRQGFGAFDFRRSYARIDSGTLATGTKLYASYSYTTADKWRGDGGAPSDRHHVSFGASQEFSRYVKADLFFDFNEATQNAFRPLTFAQIQNLNTARDLDYNPRLLNNAGQDINFFNFNREKISNYHAFSLITITPADNHRITIKPYYFREWAPRVAGVNFLGAPAIRERTNRFDRYGSVLEYDTTILNTGLKVGYWYEQFSLPIAEKYSRLQNGQLQFAQWLLTKKEGNGVINSPFVKLTKEFSALHVEAGVRYFNMYEPPVTGFNNAGIPNVGFEDAQGLNPAKDPASSYKGQTYEAWLPHAGVSYAVSKQVTTYLTYGKNYAQPQGFPEFQQIFANSRAAFNAAGLTVQSLVDRVKLATSHNVDLGVRYTTEKLYVAPVLFYTYYENLLVGVFDPALNTNVRTSAADAKAYGGEIEMGATPIENLSIYGSFLYGKSQMASDTTAASGAVVATKGHDTPDFPKFMLKGGLSYKLYGLEISPVVRYISARYGNVDNTEKIAPYTVVDLFLTYSNPKLFRALPGVKDGFLSLAFLNLFDKKYVGVINAFEDRLGGGAAYFPGAPFTVAGSVGLKF